MEVVIYRNIKGIIEPIDFKWWKSFANKLGLKLKEHKTLNTTTLTIYQSEKSASFTIYRSATKYELCLDYLRLEPEDLPLIRLIDSLIYHMRLSGEKHIINAGPHCESTYFKEDKVVNSDQGDTPSRFELNLLKEAIFGHIHLGLDELINAQRSGDTERVEKIKETFNQFQKKLSDLNEQLHP